MCLKHTDLQFEINRIFLLDALYRDTGESQKFNLVKFGGLERTRTSDLTLIRRAL